LSGPVAAFEVMLETLPSPKAKATKTKPKLELSEFQAVERDFAPTVEEIAQANPFAALSGWKKED
jgi:phenylalanyl-tRNA synthetase beta chain